MTTATEHAHEFKVTRQWILAGNATFTVKNDKGEHYTYRIQIPLKIRRAEKSDPARDKPVWFLSVLTGPDNSSSYSYVGMLTFPTPETIVLKVTKKSRYHPDIKLVKVAQWAINCICAGKELPAGYSIDGMGHCGRCGLPLTHPDGIADDGYRLGFGPVCWELMQGGN